MDNKTFILVLGIIIEMKSSHSLFLILPHGVVSVTKSAKKLVCTLGASYPSAMPKWPPMHQPHPLQEEELWHSFRC